MTAMKLLRIPVLLTTALTASCLPFGGPLRDGRPVTEAHAGGHELRVLDVESPLRAQPRVPVLSPPEVFAVYVPSHTEPDLLIGEHWLFLKLRDAEWFTERLQDPEPPAAAEVPPEQMKPLQELDWSKIVIPHKTPP